MHIPACFPQNFSHLYCLDRVSANGIFCYFKQLVPDWVPYLSLTLSYFCIFHHTVICFYREQPHGSLFSHQRQGTRNDVPLLLWQTWTWIFTKHSTHTANGWRNVGLKQQKHFFPHGAHYTFTLVLICHFVFGLTVHVLFRVLGFSGIYSVQKKKKVSISGKSLTSAPGGQRRRVPGDAMDFRHRWCLCERRRSCGVSVQKQWNRIYFQTGFLFTFSLRWWKQN